MTKTPKPTPTPLMEAVGTLAVYDCMDAEDRLSRGPVVLAEAQAYALISIAESLEQLAGESFRREVQR